MLHNSLSAKKIAKLYKNYTKLGSVAKAARKANVNLPTAYGAIKNIQRYLDNPMTKYANRSYALAAELIKGIDVAVKLESTPALKPIKAEIENAMDVLDNAKKGLDNAVLLFIDHVVDSRCGKIIAENKILKQENKNLKAVAEAAKNSNLATNLRRHFNLI